MDRDRNGSISAEELYGPLIGLGLVDSTETVDFLLRLVDDDKSGEIEFNEFKDIILNKYNDPRAHVITDFFKKLTGGSFKTKGLCFSNYVLKQRRQHLLNGIILENLEDKRRVKGRSILSVLKDTKLPDFEMVDKDEKVSSSQVDGEEEEEEDDEEDRDD